MDQVLDLNFRRHAQDLRQTWQGAVLAASLYADGANVRPKHKLGMCMLSVLSHNFDDAMPVMLLVVFPDFKLGGAPYLCSAAKIARTGHVMADMITRDGQKVQNQALFRSTRAMESEVRKFADTLHLNDAERVELFAALKRWVVADYRLDPTMNPDDPAAKRLTVH